jgi:hypothetical protein
MRQTRRRAFFQKLQDQRVSVGENLGIFGANRHQVRTIEKTPIVDLLPRDFPVGERIGLLGEQVIQQVEASRIAFLTVDDPDVLVEEGADRFVAAIQIPEALLQDLLVAVTAFDFLSIGDCPRR